MNQIYSKQISDFFKDKILVVTGGVGSVGSELTRQLLTMPIRELRVLDNNESALFDAEHLYANDPRFMAFQADITNEWEMLRVFSGADYVFHAAALKHVPSCERSPFSAVDTNILGVASVLRAAQRNSIKKVLFTSSDKAVSPTNVMGASKLMGERLFSAANFMSVGPNKGTIFSSTRFGNVAGSRGSVIPLFCKQIQQGKAVTLTDARMTRFMMSLHDAAFLVIESMVHAQGGETFITKMPSMRIYDLAVVMIRMLAPLFGHSEASIPIQEIGSRPGEKLWEELSSQEESRRILEGSKYLCVLPSTSPINDLSGSQYPGLDLQRSSCIYHSESEPKMSEEEIASFLMQDCVLPETVVMLLKGDFQQQDYSKPRVGS